MIACVALPRLSLSSLCTALGTSVGSSWHVFGDLYLGQYWFQVFFWALELRQTVPTAFDSSFSVAATTSDDLCKYMQSQHSYCFGSNIQKLLQWWHKLEAALFTFTYIAIPILRIRFHRFSSAVHGFIPWSHMDSWCLQLLLEFVCHVCVSIAEAPTTPSF